MSLESKMRHNHRAGLYGAAMTFTPRPGAWLDAEHNHAPTRMFSDRPGIAGTVADWRAARDRHRAERQDIIRDDVPDIEHDAFDDDCIEWSVPR